MEPILTNRALVDETAVKKGMTRTLRPRLWLFWAEAALLTPGHPGGPGAGPLWIGGALRLVRRKHDRQIHAADHAPDGGAVPDDLL